MLKTKTHVNGAARGFLAHPTETGGACPSTPSTVIIGSDDSNSPVMAKVVQEELCAKGWHRMAHNLFYPARHGQVRGNLSRMNVCQVRFRL